MMVRMVVILRVKRVVMMMIVVVERQLPKTLLTLFEASIERNL